MERWEDTYRKAGLVVVGVHTPEFAFEHVPSNVERAVRSLDVKYPVALDNDYGTWQAWGNQYWPAKYFVDRQGHVRYAHFGEGEYEQSENVIRTLLAEKALPPPVSGSIDDQTPTELLTPETYLGSARIDRFVGSRIVPGKQADYTIPKAVPQNYWRTADAGRSGKSASSPGTRRACGLRSTRAKSSSSSAARAASTSMSTDVRFKHGPGDGGSPLHARRASR